MKNNIIINFLLLFLTSINVEAGSKILFYGGIAEDSCHYQSYENVKKKIQKITASCYVGDKYVFETYDTTESNIAKRLPGGRGTVEIKSLTNERKKLMTIDYL